MKAALDLLHALLLVLDDEEVSSQLCTVAEKKILVNQIGKNLEAGFTVSILIFG
jgi:hypothetical protein